jgi:hypothetical protein
MFYRKGREGRKGKHKVKEIERAAILGSPARVSTRINLSFSLFFPLRP